LGNKVAAVLSTQVASALLPAGGQAALADLICCTPNNLFAFLCFSFSFPSLESLESDGAHPHFGQICRFQHKSAPKTLDSFAFHRFCAQIPTNSRGDPLRTLLAQINGT